MSDRYYRCGMAKTPAPSDVADKFMLRMPEGLRDRLKAEAEASKRSMNAEIIARLEASLDPIISRVSVNELSDDELRDRYVEINRVFNEVAEKLAPVVKNMNVFIGALNERGIGPRQENEKLEREKADKSQERTRGRRALDLE